MDIRLIRWFKMTQLVYFLLLNSIIFILRFLVAEGCLLMSRDYTKPIPQRVFGTPTVLPILNALRLMADDPERDLAEKAVLGKLVAWVEHAQLEHRRSVVATTRLVRMARKYRKLIKKLQDKICNT